MFKNKNCFREICKSLQVLIVLFLSMSVTSNGQRVLDEISFTGIDCKAGQQEINGYTVDLPGCSGENSGGIYNLYGTIEVIIPNLDVFFVSLGGIYSNGGGEVTYTTTDKETYRKTFTGYFDTYLPFEPEHKIASFTIESNEGQISGINVSKNCGEEIPNNDLDDDCDGTVDEEDLDTDDSCENLELELDVTLGGTIHWLNAKGKGGTPPYTFTANGVKEGDDYFRIYCVKNGLFYGTVTDAKGCTATDTLFNVNTYPIGDIEYSIKNDTVYFRLENQENVNFISHWSTNMPGGILTGTRNAAALPPNGRYQISVTAPGQCSDGGMSKWVDIESNEPEEPTCENLKLSLFAVLSGAPASLHANATGGTPPYTYTANATHLGDDLFTIGCGGDFYGTVTDANGCTATDTLLGVDFYPGGDLDYTIEEDYIQFKLENGKNGLGINSRASTNIPGGVLPGRRTAIPEPGEYYFCLTEQNVCSDRPVCRTVYITDAHQPEEPKTYTCEDGIGMQVILNSQEQVNSFIEFYACSSNCGKIRFDLTISGEDITDISGLSFLTEVDGMVRIEDCPNLASLKGLENIVTRYNLIIKSLPKLTNLEGINGEAIETIGNLIIRDNENLTDISALKGISIITRHLTIVNNPKLTNLNGLESITHINKNLWIEGMKPLEKDAILCNLFRNAFIGGKVRMSNNKVGSNNPFQVLNACDLVPEKCTDKADFTFKVNKNRVDFEVIGNPSNGTKYLWKLESGVFVYTSTAKHFYVFSTSGTYRVNLKVIGSCLAGITKTIVIPETTIEEEVLPTECKDNVDYDQNGTIDELDMAECECLVAKDPIAGFEFQVEGNVVSLQDASISTVGWRRWDAPYPVIDGKMTVPHAMSFNVCIDAKTYCSKNDRFCQTISIGSACDNLLENEESQNRISSEVTTSIQEIPQSLVPTQKKEAITFPVETMTIKATVLNHANCIDSEDGSIEVKVKGGQSPYQYIEIIGQTERSRLVEGTIFTKLNPDTYTVKVADAEGNETTSQIIVKAVQTDPIADFEIEEVDGKLKFVNTSANAGRWSWTFNEQTSYEKSPTPELVADFQEICLEVANGCNAKDYFCETIDMKQWGKENQITSTSLSKAKLSTPTTDFEVKAYPNPTVDQLTVSYNSATELQNIEVYNLAGKLLQIVQPQSTTSTSVALGNYPAGMYLVKVNGLTSSKILKINRIE